MTIEARAEKARPTFDVTINFEIPAQPLNTALDSYILASGAQVFFETGLTQGRLSMEIKGSLTRSAALEALLRGTGLAAQRTDVDAFIIRPMKPAPGGLSASTARPDSGFMAALQTGVLEALCRDARTQPGSYKVAIELWISPGGAVLRSALVGSTGNPARDKAVLSALQGAVIDAVPPAEMLQPFIMSISPRMPKGPGECAA